MFYVIGDLHLSAMNEWSVEVGERVISWLQTFAADVAKKDDNPSILWLGDITEKDVNPGDVIDQEYRIFSICSKYFKTTYVLMGNHDLKLYKQKAQHSLKFLRNIPNVKVIDKPEVFTVCGTKVRALPHLRVEGESLNDYYSKMRFDEDVDLTVGHWNKIDPKMPFAGGVRTDSLRTKMLCLGHIHTRTDSDYTGSVFPNKVNEAGERVYKVFDKGKLVEEVKIPTFLEYLTLTYPEKPAEHNDSIVRVYTIRGVSNLFAAKSYYIGLYIRKVEKKEIDTKKTTDYKSSSIFTYESNLQAFNDWLKETHYPIERRAAAIISAALRS